MNPIFTSVFAAAALVATGAQAADVSGPINAVGLAGRWAHVDCSQPASATNDLDIWSVQPDGTAAELNDGGTAYQSRFRWDSAQVTGAGKIALAGVYADNGHAFQLVIEVQGDRQRTYYSRDTTAGQDLIVDAVMKGNNAPADWYTRCR